MLEQISISLIKIAGFKKNPKASLNIIKTPTSQAFNPSEIVAKSIKASEQSPKTKVPNVAIPKPTYDGISSNQMRQVSQSFYSPFKKSMKLVKF